MEEKWLGLLAIPIVGFIVKFLLGKTIAAYDEKIQELKEEQEEIRERYVRRIELDALRANELHQLQQDTKQLDQDIKNLGDKFQQVIREEVGLLRADQRDTSREYNERMDKLIQLVSSR